MTKAELRKLIKRHKGNVSGIQRALEAKGEQITRQGVSGRIERAKLGAYADKYRMEARVPGKPLKSDAEKKKIARLLARYGKVETAKKLGMARTTLWRRMKMYGIKSAV